ncbi:MAG: hypothetical protein ACK5XP_13025, partial [Sphingobacteriia bacterium]
MKGKITPNPTRRLKIYLFGIFCLCFALYPYLSDEIRANYRGNVPVIIYLLGVAPNFFAAIGVSAFLVGAKLEMTKPQKAHTWHARNLHIWAALLSSAGLIGWEFLQIVSRRAIFDWNDILWTLIGAVVFLLL